MTFYVVATLMELIEGDLLADVSSVLVIILGLSLTAIVVEIGTVVLFVYCSIEDSGFATVLSLACAVYFVFSIGTSFFTSIVVKEL